MLTIFTPTYNRAHTLSRLYNSIKEQNDEFIVEWIIVDDESTDETEIMVNKWINENDKFDIIYLRQKRGGKHRAINLGVEKAQGEWFFIMDSDDYLVPGSIDKVVEWCQSIVDKHICGISGECEFVSGDEAIQVKHTKNLEMLTLSNLERIKYDLTADRCEVIKTDILKRYKFPEYKDEYFVTEAIVWDKLAIDGFSMNYYNSSLCVCEYMDDGLTKNGANTKEGYIKNYFGYTEYVKQRLKCYPLNYNLRLLYLYLVISKDKEVNYNTILEQIECSHLQFMSILLKVPVLMVYNKISKLI